MSLSRKDIERLPAAARKAVQRQIGTPPARACDASGPNRWERDFMAYLDGLKLAGTVLWWSFEKVKLKLADNTFYTPDFCILWAGDTRPMMAEVKGWFREDARIKYKIAREAFPLFHWQVVRKVKGQWELSND